MKPTPTEITECTDEKQLCEWAAVYCMGWTKKTRYPLDGEFMSRDEWSSNDGETGEYCDDWMPTIKTPTGKSQAMDLASKYGLDISMPYDSTDTALVKLQTGEDVEDYSWQIAVVKAAILSAIGE